MKPEKLTDAELSGLTPAQRATMRRIVAHPPPRRGWYSSEDIRKQPCYACCGGGAVQGAVCERCEGEGYLDPMRFARAAAALMVADAQSDRSHWLQMAAVSLIVALFFVGSGYAVGLKHGHDDSRVELAQTRQALTRARAYCSGGRP